MQLFSVENIFFAHKNIKKTALKSSILMALRFFFCSPDYPKQPRISFPFYKLFYPIISTRVKGPNVPKPTGAPVLSCFKIKLSQICSRVRIYKKS